MQSQENVSDTLGLASPIVKIMKHEKENSRYTIFLENGTKIKLPNVSHLLSQARLRNSVALFTKTCINRIPNKNWQSVSQALLDLVEDGYQTTFEEQVMTWMREYLAYSTIHEDLDEYFRNNATGPFIYAGRAHIRLVPFMEWLAQRKGVKEPRRKITAALRENGILPAKLKIKIEDSFLRIRAWRIRI